MFSRFVIVQNDTEPNANVCAGLEEEYYFEVSFKLRDSTVFKRNPYNMSREKTLCLKKGPQRLLHAGIVEPSKAHS